MEAAARTNRIALSLGAKLAARAIALAGSFVVVDLLVEHLGRERYGVYATAVSVVGWIGLLQLGVAPSLLTELARAADQRDDARRLAATAFWVQLGLAAALALPFAAIWYVVPWGALLNAPPEIAGEVALAIGILIGLVLLRLPSSLADAIYNAYQEGHIAALWAIAGTAATVGAVSWAVDAGAELPAITLAAQGPAIAVLVVAGLVLIALHRRDLFPSPRLFSRELARKLTRIGGSFTIVAVAGMVITATDNLIIARVLGPDAVTPYAVTYLLIQAILAFVMAALDAAWPAYSSAAARGDVAWIRHTHRRLTRWIVLGLAGCGAILAVFGQEIVALWAGPDAAPSRELVVVFGVLTVVQGSLLPVGRLITALGAVRANARAGMLNAGVNLACSLVLVYVLGAVGVAVGTILGYVATAFVLIPTARRQLQELEQHGRPA